MPYVYLTIAIFCEVIATSLLKKTDGFTNLVFTIFVLCAYGTSFYFLSITVKYLSVSVAYSIWCGMGIFLISLIDYFILKHNLNIKQVMGMLLIIGGVVIIKYNTNNNV